MKNISRLFGSVSLMTGACAPAGADVAAESEAITAAAPITTFRVTCRGFAPTIVGTAGNDFITGTAGPDVILGLGGDDVILGMDGDNILCGGEGRDTVRAGRGYDRVWGDQGADTLRGDEDGGNHALADTSFNCETVVNVP